MKKYLCSKANNKNFVKYILFLALFLFLTPHLLRAAQLDFSWDPNLPAENVIGYTINIGKKTSCNDDSSCEFKIPPVTIDIPVNELSNPDKPSYVLERGEGAWCFYLDAYNSIGKSHPTPTISRIIDTAGTTSPLIAITSPTSATYETNKNTINIRGTSSDDVCVESVTWIADSGNGTASGATSWTQDGIALREGDNVITVTVLDSAGNTSTDTVTVTYTVGAVLPRISEGLVVLYDFAEGVGDIIRDISGIPPVLDLFIESGTVNWLEDRSGIEIAAKSIIRNNAAAKLHEELTATNELTVEVWIEPADLIQGGPGRIVSYSQDTGFRNFTLGQESTEYDMRMQTTNTDQNGMPSLRTSGGQVKEELQQIVVTYDGNQKIFYVNGQESGKRQTIGGDFSRWNSGFEFIIGNEATGDRPWLGEIYLLAIYNRALTAGEIARNYDAGIVVPGDEVDLSLPPTDLIVTTTNCQADLNWTDNSDNETGFRIERREGIDGNWGQIDTVNADVNTYRDMDDLGVGITYHYRVYAYNAGGDSTSSDQDSVTIPSYTYYQDSDLDGYGNPKIILQSCSTPTGYVTDDTDCDDTRFAVHPGATEVCNKIDDDCDNEIDENVICGNIIKEFGEAAKTDYPGTCLDTFINFDNPSENASSEDYLYTYTWPANVSANRIILEWDLSSIPASAEIKSATLYLYKSGMYGSGGDDAYEVSVHKIINLNPDISTCSWNNYNRADSWTGGEDGGNQDMAAAEDSQVIDKISGEYKAWTVTKMVADWVVNPSVNFGMILESDKTASSDSNRYFSSSNHMDKNRRPKLVIVYSPGVDLPIIIINTPQYKTYISDTVPPVVDVDFSYEAGDLDNAWYKVGVNGSWMPVFSGYSGSFYTDNFTVINYSEGINVIYFKVTNDSGTTYEPIGIDTLTIDVDSKHPGGTLDIQ